MDCVFIGTTRSTTDGLRVYGTTRSTTRFIGTLMDCVFIGTTRSTTDGLRVYRHD